jgi:hypothetical protein
MVCHGGDSGMPRLNSPIRALARAVSWTLAAIGILALMVTLTSYTAEVLLASTYVAELPAFSERGFFTPGGEDMPDLPHSRWAVTQGALVIFGTCGVLLSFWTILFMFWRSPRLEPPHLPKRKASDERR